MIGYFSFSRSCILGVPRPWGTLCFGKPSPNHLQIQRISSKHTVKPILYQGQTSSKQRLKSSLEPICRWRPQGTSRTEVHDFYVPVAWMIKLKNVYFVKERGSSFCVFLRSEGLNQIGYRSLYSILRVFSCFWFRQFLFSFLKNCWKRMTLNVVQTCCDSTDRKK